MHGRLTTGIRAKSISFFCLLAFSALASSQGFRIDSWDETIQIRKDAVVHIEERIAVTFTEPRHGLFRQIPVTYDTGRGTLRSIFLKGVKVLDENGRPQTFADTREGRNRKLRIGDADITLKAGTRKTYVIRYLATNALNWFNDPKWVPAAELYWNVTGNEWPVNIRNVKVKIEYPKASNGKGVRIKVFTGPLGSRTSHLVEKLTPSSRSDKTATTISLSADQATVSRAQPLPTGHGLTIVLNVPSKLVPKQKIVEEEAGNSTDYSGGSSYYDPTPYFDPRTYDSPRLPEDPRAPIAALCIPVAVLALMGALWFGFGRDPSGGPLVVQYEPPDNLSGPECGVMIDEVVDSRDIAAGVVSLAVKGLIRIHPHEEGFLFKSRSASIEVIRRTPGEEMSSFERMLFAKISACGDWVTDLDMRQCIAPYAPDFVSLLYDSLVNKGYYRASPVGSRAIWKFIGGLLSIGLGVVVWLMSPASVLPVVIGTAGGILVAAFTAQGMPKRTQQGAEVRQKILGFEEFMARARSQELNWMSEKHPDQAMFEKYLPHAIAFDLVKEWADAFKGIVEAMPTWYVGAYDGGFDLGYLASDLVGVTESVGSFITSPPRSASSSSDGGFWSGGGFSSGSSGFSSGFGSGFGSSSSSHSSGGGGYSGGGAGGGGGGSW